LRHECSPVYGRMGDWVKPSRIRRSPGVVLKLRLGKCLRKTRLAMYSIDLHIYLVLFDPASKPSSHVLDRAFPQSHSGVHGIMYIAHTLSLTLRHSKLGRMILYGYSRMKNFFWLLGTLSDRLASPPHDHHRDAPSRQAPASPYPSAKLSPSLALNI
jgi:hypothetical protein